MNQEIRYDHDRFPRELYVKVVVTYRVSWADHEEYCSCNEGEEMEEYQVKQERICRIWNNHDPEDRNLILNEKMALRNLDYTINGCCCLHTSGRCQGCYLKHTAIHVEYLEEYLNATKTIHKHAK